MMTTPTSYHTLSPTTNYHPPHTRAMTLSNDDHAAIDAAATFDPFLLLETKSNLKKLMKD